MKYQKLASTTSSFFILRSFILIHWEFSKFLYLIILLYILYVNWIITYKWLIISI